ncbi:MAG TPA: acyl-CoA reductase, partial [Clostridium sp.]|nr:acyl-CoA reductase [Clostridium sp.]
PNVLFIEKSNIPLKHIVKVLERSFQKIGKRYKNILDENTCAEILNKRGMYSLDLTRDICCSGGLEYTIL